jgi:hypothetical protein
MKITVHFTVQLAPVDDQGGHTSYMLLPHDPGRVVPFPSENFHLTTAAHRRVIAAWLWEHHAMALVDDA